jgi:hypothetical protein
VQRSIQNVGYYFCNFHKLAKVLSHSMDEYSPNLVTLPLNQLSNGGWGTIGLFTDLKTGVARFFLVQNIPKREN